MLLIDNRNYYVRGIDSTRLMGGSLPSTSGCAAALDHKIRSWHTLRQRFIILGPAWCRGIPSPRFLMPTPIFIYGAELVLSPPDLATDMFEHVNTILGWHQPSIVGAIKMWDCLTQHSVPHFSVWRRVFANSPQINGLSLPSETIVCKTIGNLWESIAGAAWEELEEAKHPSTPAN